MNLNTVILAAGKGTRMKSRRPKVLHRILGRPMLSYAIETARAVSPNPPAVVIGYMADEVRNALGGDGVLYVVQEEQLGTGHAVSQVMPLLRDKAHMVLVTYGDMPLLRVETLRRMVELHKSHRSPVTMLTVKMDDPHGFGRVIRGESGGVLRIVEEAHATPEERSIRELNAGVYVFDADWLWEHLPRLPLSPKGEYYLTDLVGMAADEGNPAMPLTVDDPDEVIGVNTRVHLAQVAEVLRRRINERWMLDGVTIVDPASTFIEPTVTIGRDTVIYPNTHLRGKTTIGEDCEIGPNTIIVDSVLGNRCEVKLSVVERAELEDDVDIGPFAHLRKGAHLARGVHLGNFGEVKNSYLGPGTKMGHFSYIGDATIGENVNIGAGTITCNYDGEKKNPTYIEDDVFIGSDTMLVAPVRVGKGSKTGAGSVVTRDIPPESLAYGVPARVKRSLK
jgi:bifunctional UDP-N-acetylglucosamine pyrophosphorylase/glucosamine-1-phosphate N-acetyltransferase